MKLSVMVVTFNDDKYLEKCLFALRRFDELIVVDLGSSDRSVEIAQNQGFKVIIHPWVPIGEMIYPDLKHSMRNNWILRVDPDEIFSSDLVDQLLILEIGDDYGMITIPFQYYFMNRKLDTTAWGGIRYATRVSHKERTFMESGVHGKHLCKEGYGIYQIDFSNNNVAAHYWVDNLSQMFSKHERYLKMEGASRYGKGARFSWAQVIKQTLVHFRFSFIQRSGWRGGWAGWFLSFFYAQYEARSWLALRQYEKHLGVDRVE
jgi:glycosyltransferase involved in cell wall biosynthesis